MAYYEIDDLGISQEQYSVWGVGYDSEHDYAHFCLVGASGRKSMGSNEDWHVCFHLQQSSMQPCHHAFPTDDDFYRTRNHASKDSRSDFYWAEPYACNAITDNIYADVSASQQSKHVQHYSMEPNKQTNMETLLIRSPSKRQRDCIHDPCDIPLKRSCRQEGNDATFTCGCDELPFSPYSNRFTVRNLDGVEKSLELDDLVDMVLQVAKDVEDSNIAEHVVNLSKRRLQNKMAAARYRDKQKERHRYLQKEQVELERKNAKLKEIVQGLEREVVEYKAKIMQITFDLTH
ncbi:hypothetical protein RB195_002462 [Necator americanus]|uniref:BZIP domain-containing protein n=1 Tax=Necator americanus TaxID=51031 RepID=A0ABR1DJ61_NECAM